MYHPFGTKSNEISIVSLQFYITLNQESVYEITVLGIFPCSLLVSPVVATFSSLGTHSACELSPGDVRLAGK